MVMVLKHTHAQHYTNITETLHKHYKLITHSTHTALMVTI